MKSGMRKVLAGLCIIGAGLCIGFVAHYIVQTRQNERIYKELQSEWQTAAEMESETAAETETQKQAEIPMDFESLKQINPEIYAWIEIPGTDVGYPIVQSASDDDYYLNHTIEGIAGYPGSIYTESVNTRDFKDFNTLIYGHDMDDGSMFGGLHLFRDESYRKEHETLIIYTPEHKYTYRIFSALTYDDRHIGHSFNFSAHSDRKDYLASIGNTDPEVTTDSRLVTLSTCIFDQPNHRLLVEAVLINEE